MSDEESVWAIVGRQYSQALQRRTDEKFYRLMDQVRDPDKYHRCKTTYKGIAAKRRLYMKAGLA